MDKCPICVGSLLLMENSLYDKDRIKTLYCTKCDIEFHEVRDQPNIKIMGI